LLPRAQIYQNIPVNQIPLTVQEQGNNLAQGVVPPPKSLPRQLDRTEIYQGSDYPNTQAGSPIGPSNQGNSAGQIPQSISEQEANTTLSSNPDLRKGIVWEQAYRQQIYQNPAGVSRNAR
jgi:hypothetical protein